LLGVVILVFGKQVCVNLFRATNRFLGLFAEKLSVTPIRSENNSIAWSKPK